MAASEKAKKASKATMDTLNTALAILNHYGDGGSIESLKISQKGTTTAPFDFLLQLLKLMFDEDKLYSIIGGFLTAGLAPLEVTIKTVMISNLRDLVSCSLNMFISDDVLNEGFYFDLTEIDILNKLSYCPLDEEKGRFQYFGIYDWFDGEYKTNGEITIPDDLYKCKDFDAVLWYMRNRANGRIVWYGSRIKNRQLTTPQPEMVYAVKDGKTDDFADITTGMDAKKLKEIDEKKSSIIEFGKQFWDDSKKGLVDIGKSYRNWDMDGVVTLEYVESTSSAKNAIGEKTFPQIPSSNAIHIFMGNTASRVTEDISALNQRMKMINETIGVVLAENKNITKTIKEKQSSVTFYDDPEETQINEGIAGEIIDLENKYKENEAFLDSLSTFKAQCYDEIHQSKKGQASGMYPTLADNVFYRKPIMYFNTAYIANLQLFDGKVLAAQILDSLTGRLHMDYEFSLELRFLQEEIKKMITDITNTDETIVNDCFFSFSNSEYDRMYKKAEMSRMGINTNDGKTVTNTVSSEDLNNILNNITAAASGEDFQRSVVEGLKETKNLMYNLGSNKKWYENIDGSVQWGAYTTADMASMSNFLDSLLDALSFSVCSSILSPKFYILMGINLKLIGENSTMNLDQFIAKYKEMLVNFIRTTRDEIIKWFVKELMLEVKKLAHEIGIIIMKEQFDYYIELLTSILRCIKSFNFGYGGNGWTMDAITADIEERDDTTTIIGQEC